MQDIENLTKRAVTMLREKLPKGVSINERSKEKKKKIKDDGFLLSIVLVIVFIGIGAVIWDAPAREELKNTVIAEVNFRNKDGSIRENISGRKTIYET